MLTKRLFAVHVLGATALAGSLAAGALIATATAAETAIAIGAADGIAFAVLMYCIVEIVRAEEADRYERRIKSDHDAPPEWAEPLKQTRQGWRFTTGEDRA